jgi:RNA polymerase sigma-70 factor (ECF subfamily)
MAAEAPLAEAFSEHRQALWDLCYRLTGTAADADDLVQETFARAVARPPRLDEPLRPWLFRVAVNLGRDLLRRRKRQPYVGPWLPSPIETGDRAEPEAPALTPEGRYGLLESASFAFLLAIEALTPKQRAVLLLREVFDYPLRETAQVLGITENAVAVIHHRARAAMAAYDRARCVPTRALQQRTREKLEAFFGAVMMGDVSAVEALLAEDVRSYSDGAGQYTAALNPIDGTQRVSRYFLGIAGKLPPGAAVEVQLLNGLPALVANVPYEPGGRFSRHVVVTCDLDPSTGLIRALHVVVADAKLSAVHFPTA